MSQQCQLLSDEAFNKATKARMEIPQEATTVDSWVCFIYRNAFNHAVARGWRATHPEGSVGYNKWELAAAWPGSRPSNRYE